jgi:hypothetical protein
MIKLVISHVKPQRSLKIEYKIKQERKFFIDDGKKNISLADEEFNFPNKDIYLSEFKNLYDSIFWKNSNN